MIKQSPLLLLLLTLPGCAAMVRTWHFTADPVQGTALRVTLARSAVKQTVAHVTLRLHNESQTPQRVSVGTLTLTLPDGQRLAGKTSLMGRTSLGVQNTLAGLGLGRRATTPVLPAGGSLEASVAFRVHGRDLRRHSALRLDLSGIRVNDQPLRTATMVLRAPAGAPMGEHI